jgi:hypothetical protein
MYERTTKQRPIEIRFWEKVDRRGPNECWLWLGSKSGPGYGNLKGVDRKTVYAHRVSYEINTGPIPDGLMVDHACMTRPCVNPSHLRLATIKQNNENLPGARSTSRSGIRGVHQHPNGRFYAYVIHNRKRVHLGGFDDPEDADAAVVAKRKELFTHNTLDRKAS